MVHNQLINKIIAIGYFILILAGCDSRHNNHMEEYVRTADPAFRYNIEETFTGEGWTEYRVKMVSGTWLTKQEVNHPEWWHWVTIVVPDEVTETEALMVIGGGSTEDEKPQAANELLVQAAVGTKSIIAEISNIPFQPLNYVNDEKDDRFEDDLIAYGWRQYLEGGAKDEDVEWLAHIPMTRAVVRAMDVVQEISADLNKPVDSFVVAGASKRGWATWTTAIVDDRVIAIIPVVIDVLNVESSFNHHWRCYGAWSPAINDYINEGIMDWTGSKEYARLLELVEPYSFIDQLTLPKFLINATGDEFFITDSWQFYWDDLVGDKYIQYVPNANHGLNGTYNLGSLVAFYNAVITESAIPKVDWSVSADSIYLEVLSDVDYKVTKWEAVNENARDFRVPVIGKVWKDLELSKTPDNQYAIHFSAPENGYKAGLLEIVFDSGTEVPFTFTTGTVVTPNAYPFGPFTPNNPQGIPVK
mgnify:FL=1